MNNLKVTKEIKGAEAMETLLRIIESGKCQVKAEASDSGEITKVNLAAGPEELEFTGNSFGNGKLIVRATVREEDLAFRITFINEALEKAKKLGMKEVVDFKSPQTSEDAKDWADSACKALGVEAWQNYKLEKVTMKHTATGDKVTSSTAIDETEMPF